jgi:hypothetical protein
MARVTPSKNFFEGDRACMLAKLLDVFNSLIDFLLPTTRLRDDSRDGLPVPGDDDGLTALDFVEEPGKMGFGLGCLNFARHGENPLVGLTG